MLDEIEVDEFVEGEGDVFGDVEGCDEGVARVGGGERLVAGEFKGEWDGRVNRKEMERDQGKRTRYGAGRPRSLAWTGSKRTRNCVHRV